MKKQADEVVGVMFSAQNMHGGQEQAILPLYKTMYHWGAIPAAPGYTEPVLFEAGGNRYGANVTVGRAGMKGNIEAAVKHQAKQTVTMARAWSELEKIRPF